MNIGKFSLKNSVLMNILMGTIILMGLLAFFKLPKEESSDISFSWFFVRTIYPGVSAEDIEKSITVKIEDELQDIERVKRITSKTSEGSSFIQVEFEDGLPKGLLRKLMQDVRNDVDKVKLPDGAEIVYMDEFTMSDFMPIVSVTASSNASTEWVNEVVKDLQKDILRVQNVSKADIIGGQEREVWAQLDRDKLIALGLSPNEVISAIEYRHLNVPAGVVEGKSNFTARTAGELSEIVHLDSVIVRTVKDEGVVRLSDVASINGGMAKAETEMRQNGNPGVSLNISKTKSGNAIEIVDEIREIVNEYQERYDGDIDFVISGDTTVRIKDILGSLGSNSIVGIILLFITLFLFLGVRNSLIVSLGIPVTFGLTFIFLDTMGYSLSSASTFALVLVLGMIVDHAIVIIENIYRHRQEGKDIEDAVEAGTNEVVIPVIAATATTIAAFLPLILLPGVMGAFMRIIPLVVTLALIASTFEALFFIPVHFAEWGSRVRGDSKFFVWLKRVFKNVVTPLYEHRWKTVIVSLIIIIGSFALGGKAITVALFDSDVLPQFTINISLPMGSSREDVNNVIQRYEKVLLDSLGNGEIKTVNSYIGFMETETEWLTEDNVGQVKVFLEDGGKTLKREKVQEICDRYKDLCSGIPGADEISYQIVKAGPPVDKPISLRILGQDIDDMVALTDSLKLLIERIPPEVVQDQIDSASAFDKLIWKYFPDKKPNPEKAPIPYNIEDNFNRNTPEFVISVDERRAADLGLSVAEIGMFFRTAVEGQIAATFFDDGEDIDILVKFAEGEIRNSNDFEELLIPTADGRQVPFSTVCKVKEQDGIVKIEHYKGERAIKVVADMNDEDKALAKAINEKIGEYYKENLQGLFPGIALSMEGEFEEFNRVIQDIVGLMFVAIFLLYIILGTQFKSYVQPFIMFATIPFAVVGVILFMVVSGTYFTMAVMYSAVALIGISVNDSIVLISFINHNRRVNGMNTEEAVINAAVTRLRPIILTSVTTMGGLIPLAVGIGGYSPVWGPMASTIIFGLFFSTAGTLLIIPCAYGIIDAIMNKMGLKMKLEGE